MNQHVKQELPSNIEAEQALLGAVLVNNQTLQVVASTGIEPEDFYEPLHRKIYEALRSGIRAGRKVNPVTVKASLSPDDVAKMVGGMTVSQYIARLATDAVSAFNAPDHAAAIISAAQRRNAISISEVAEVAAFKSEQDSDFVDRMREVRDRAEAIIRALEGDQANAVSFSDAVDETLLRTSDAAAGKQIDGVDPGLPEILSLTGPWQPGQLIIIGGGVKQGKSALAMQSMFTIAEKHAVGINSGEMSRDQLIMREKARRSGVSAKDQKTGRVTDKQMDALLLAGQEMKRLHHVDIDCRRLTLPQIDAKIGRLIAEHGIKIYCLDHIGKIQWTGKMEYEDEFKQGQRATSILKDLAQKHNIPIVALTHLKKSTFQEYQGRNFKERLQAAMSRRPTYRDLVGNMDKDADQVLVVFQPRPIIAGMEPAEGTGDHHEWEMAIEKVTGHAEIILSLSRESEFPRRRDVRWIGRTTSYGQDYATATAERTLF